MAEILQTYVPKIGKDFQNIFLNHVLRGTSFSGSVLYMALFKETVYEDLPDISVIKSIAQELGITVDEYMCNNYYTRLPVELWTSATEVTENNYSRVSCSGIWTITNGSAVNNAEIRFSVANSDWENIAHYGFYNDQTAGSLLFYGMFSASFTLDQNNILVFPVDSIKLSLTDAYSKYLSGKLLDHYLNDNAYSPPSSTYLALYLTTPNWDGEEELEVSGSVGYDRIQFTSACWTPAEHDDDLPCSGGSTINTGLAQFTDYAVTDWGPINGIALWDHATTGNMLYYGSLYPPVVIIEPDGFAFPPRSITIHHNDESRSIIQEET